MKDESSDRAELTFDPSKRNVFVRVAFLGTALYEQPDEESARLAYLNKGTVLEAMDDEVGFLHVRTEDGAEGYIRRSSVVPGAAQRDSLKRRRTYQ